MALLTRSACASLIVAPTTSKVRQRVRAGDTIALRSHLRSRRDSLGLLRHEDNGQRQLGIDRMSSPWVRM
jgi:hypothetical protein